MKLLLILFSFLLLSSCLPPDSNPDKIATVVITSTKYKNDTIRIEYYQNLHLHGQYLRDGNENAFSYDVDHFSIIDSVKTIK